MIFYYWLILSNKINVHKEINLTLDEISLTGLDIDNEKQLKNRNTGEYYAKIVAIIKNEDETILIQSSVTIEILLNMLHFKGDKVEKQFLKKFHSLIFRIIYIMYN